MSARKPLSWVLYWICWAFDQMPWRDGIDKRWYAHYGLGCLWGISRLAARIEGER